MQGLSHWHPVLLSRELGRAPVRVTVNDVALVLFRSGHRVAALADRCAHRGMPLSLGRVKEGCLECPYHGWTWNAEGQGKSPGNPKLKPHTMALDCVERDEIIWVREHASDRPFPFVDTHGHWHVGTSRHRVRAPLELVLDNFIEVEHTADVHAVLGYAREEMANVTCSVTATEDSVRVFNRGVQRRLPTLMRWALGLPDPVDFVDDWTTRFSPVHSVYEQYFVECGSDRVVGEAIRIAVFFTPVDANTTDLFVMAYTTAAPWERWGLSALIRPILAQLVQMEVRRDQRLLERLVGVDPSLRGRALGRFDQALVLTRERLNALYRR